MKLFTRILLMVIASFLVGNVVVNACGDEKEIVIHPAKDVAADEPIDLTPDFPIVTSLIHF
jgi:hypothetical protein